MEPNRWRQIDDLYHAALKCAPDERAAFLTETCVGDEERAADGGDDLDGGGEAVAWLDHH